ncbi:MAG: Nif3-like dinuclear metal center hexameric protein [Halieaceae bacterium]
MPVSLSQLEQTFDELLRPAQFRDYVPNGLQLQGREEVGLVVSGVSACQDLIDAALAMSADAVLVHHGFFWRNESPVITGMKRRRIGALLAADVSLFAYHLPLDAHPQFGNNACLARLLDIRVDGELDPGDPDGVGNVGQFAEPLPMAALLQRIEQQLQRPPLHVGDPERPVQRVAWCTGSAQDYIEAAVKAGAEVYITGEVSEQTVHVAREEGIEFIAAGHHATERYGVQAVGEEISRRLGIEHRFIDIDNPV